MTRPDPYRITLLLLLTGVSSLGVVLVACSSPTVSGVSSPADSSPSDGGAEASTGSATGSINLFGSAFSHTLQANFSFLADKQADPRCAVTKSGPCTLSDCTNYDGGSNPLAHAAGAGTIVFKGGYPEMSLTAMPNADGTYTAQAVPYPGAPTERPFSGGEPATLTASGGTVPAFSQSMRYPLLFILDDPAVPDGGSDIPVSRAKDFSFAWSRGSADADLIVQGTSEAGATTTFLNCTFPSAQGNAMIPQAVITKLEPNTMLLLFSAAKQITRAGDFDVTTYLAGEVINPSKNVGLRLVVE